MNEIYDLIIDYISRYNYLADEVLNRNYDSVVCKVSSTDEYGEQDENYMNRSMLIFLMTALRNDIICEEIVIRLFMEEVKSCRINSFGGIGSSLEILSAMLWEYNTDGRYDKAFEMAKNANFDCQCGYHTKKGAYTYQLGTDQFRNMSLIESVEFLFYALGIKEGLEQFLDRIESEYFNDYDALAGIKNINDNLGRKEHNSRYYQLLEEKMSKYNIT